MTPGRITVSGASGHKHSRQPVPSGLQLCSPVPIGQSHLWCSFGSHTSGGGPAGGAHAESTASSMHAAEEKNVSGRQRMFPTRNERAAM